MNQCRLYRHQSMLKDKILSTSQGWTKGAIIDTKYPSTSILFASNGIIHNDRALVYDKDTNCVSKYQLRFGIWPEAIQNSTSCSPISYCRITEGGSVFLKISLQINVIMLYWTHIFKYLMHTLSCIQRLVFYQPCILLYMDNTDYITTYFVVCFW